MGQNSTDVAYGFGQFGSTYLTGDGAKLLLTVSTVLLVFIDAGVITFEVKSSWVDLLQLVLITVIGAYFGGRSFEKIKK